ncbi:hypothetical protein [Streptomyces alkaliterrae]|uniref:Uncharacterized protein n=1 Tax=Streptomyces alkaliterrae TaxID=2213162 RepID=A0A7W3WY05_9ACTN|nr:hypothetical protein [Streptomyces alkaliterrae]MBB1260496.1 hypothetical protein [Streptomyces alkaliterrae]
MLLLWGGGAGMLSGNGSPSQKESGVAAEPVKADTEGSAPANVLWTAGDGKFD